MKSWPIEMHPLYLSIYCQINQMIYHHASSSMIQQAWKGSINYQLGQALIDLAAQHNHLKA